MESQTGELLTEAIHASLLGLHKLCKINYKNSIFNTIIIDIMSFNSY